MPEFVIVDVFAEQRYGGNPLAVVLDAGSLDGAEMQAVAREFDFSETTFVCAPLAAPGPCPVRIFTPTEEIPFAGHPTLGTAWVLRALAGGEAASVELALGIGAVTVAFEGTGEGARGWLRPPAPELGAEVPRATAARVLGLDEADLDPALAVQRVGVGVSFWLVPVKGLAALGRCDVDARTYRAEVPASGATGALGVLAFCREGHEPGHDLAARVFFDAGGIREDPATGSANACLAAWLSHHRVGGDARVDARVGQGVEMGRPSLLHLRAGDPAHVEVGGGVVAVARGRLLRGASGTLAG
jgi:trans-2,3-dihydro-3-hydroxyanthranilate isomerase